MKHGVRRVMIAGSVSALSRLISRQRDEKCADTATMDSWIRGKMAEDNDRGNFLIFDKICPQTNFLHLLRKKNGKFGDTFVPTVHVLTSSRSTGGYDFVLTELKTKIPNWKPTDYLGDLKIGQSKALNSPFFLLFPSPSSLTSKDETAETGRSDKFEQFSMRS
ncbi:unnamed protein product [Caenorhabditis sp. 36 PRJEB53466]|nr:unnamed protein product [Caenorhabditis sp. 36 PRJEB53466]